ncbi:hypothetical protein A3D08_00335 [Candidatus Roizmanbacteria bacterium RIFCSPHIGHO2_02_FULL_43_11]|uniref:Terminase large subunit gp17-like C-terminal domain-containing protein n=1 Tax=Candidatus Roizmanbacteria bacterium RIFCSPHIGHO2_02_FULL_43_11 TaxID=1802043 RepID=A0A1F7HGA8_9BACT|nr:MAG: hypothetical protein A3D08_00335 [Candidatus Roizmanbacteria bacterium RIFCSPHIGHO2_02_FULL_43_11]
MTDDNLSRILNTREGRITLASQSLEWFATIYFPHYLSLEPASFHKEMFHLADNPNKLITLIIAFRGSAKSTIFSFFLPLYAVLGLMQKKHIVIFSQTQSKVEQILQSIKTELETNELLRRDFGKFEVGADVWRANSLILSKYNARIAAYSTGESIRGVRHGHIRPDMMILDDVEDTESVRTQEGRDKIYNWFTSDVLPAGDRITDTFIVGNLLHNDSFVARWKSYLKENPDLGVCKEYPLIDENGVILWKAKYPTQESIEKEKKKTANIRAFLREYMLKIVPEDDVVIYQEWIQYGGELPDRKSYISTIISVDLAISLKTSADYTAIIVAQVYKINGVLKIYILPHPLNKRLTFPETEEYIISLYKGLVAQGFAPKVIFEKVGYQESLEQQLKREGVRIEGVPVIADKRERLSLASPFVQAGNVLFSKNGNDLLIQQLLEFGTEKHDDLVDAFSQLVNYVSARSGSTAVADFYRDQVDKIAQEQSIAEKPTDQLQRMLFEQYGIMFKGMI